jgi:methanethiol S-methyltransferase
MLESFFWIILAIGVYGLVHSLLASKRAKALACRLNPQLAGRYYRLFFNLFGAVSFVPVLALAAFLPDRPIYSIPFPWRLLTFAGQVLAASGLLAGVLQTGAASFLGLAQWSGRGEDLCVRQEALLQRSPTALVTSGLYHWVRHPLYTCGLLLIWLTPVLSWNGLAFNTGVTVYILVGIYFEERKLLAEFGDCYADYQRVTPMLIPGLKGIRK